MTDQRRGAGSEYAAPEGELSSSRGRKESGGNNYVRRYLRPFLGNLISVSRSGSRQRKSQKVVLPVNDSSATQSKLPRDLNGPGNQAFSASRSKLPANVRLDSTPNDEAVSSDTDSSAQSTAPENPANIFQDSNNLWKVAFEQLSSEQSSLTAGYLEILSGASKITPGLDAHEQAQALLQLKRDRILRKQWKLQWGNKSIIVREKVDRIVKLLGVIKDIGSSVASLDPIHAGLPWAGICFLLSVSWLIP